MKKLILQESIMSDLDAMAREHSDVKEFILAALSDEYFNLKRDKDTIEFLKVIFDGAHKDLDMAPMQVTEKKATYCGRCGHTHVKGTPCPRPFKEGLSPYGDDAYFVTPNKGKKMTKEDILKIVKEVLAENVAYDIESTDGTKTVQSFANDAEATAFKSTNTNIKAVKKLEEEDLDLGHEDDEPHMIKSELYKVAKYALELYKMVDQFEGKGEVDFPAWWQSKITKATSMISSAKHYLEFELSEPAVDSMVGVEEAKKAKKLDPVGHEDADIDNDGDTDKTDKYLKNKRVKIGAAIAQAKKK
jgi:hypothetical protein